ncbi:hypothetical protein WMY93_013131 [Mugilogobius chulae]|uniref:SCAN box domain-containing protein n=1 Tax=Mugilogobius chulae TaxID=88201 RepID=A0AAW0NYL4_9GOBI
MGVSRFPRSDADPDSSRDSLWDAWGPWSDCSRTCGGGASYSLRRCLDSGNCDGKNIRYKTCSNTDCPLETGDFRAQQCSAHNDVKLQGESHEWTPAPYDPLAPCTLRCQAKGGSLTVELAPKVLDGTRCRDNALDMCINGVCQSVVEVPVGSRFLRISAKGPAIMMVESVSVLGRREETALVSSGSFALGNTSVDFQKGSDRQTLKAHSPLGADYVIKMKYGGPKETVVQFLFYQPIQFQWRETDFFPCSVSCGGGYQLNSAECVDIRSNQSVPEHHCTNFPENTKPTPRLRECSLEPCSESDGFKEVMPYDHFQPLPRWETGPWTSCSVSCGDSGGWQDRSVQCVEEDTRGQLSSLEDWRCGHSPRPITRQICNAFACPQWVAMEWSQCTVTCGRGLRYRVVLCIDHRGQHIGGCNPSTKPHVKEDCLVPIACHKPRESVPVEDKEPWLKQAQSLEEHHMATEEPTFVPGSWSPCSASCGPGLQTRELKCQVLLSFTKTEVDLPEEECGGERPQSRGRATWAPVATPDRGLSGNSLPQDRAHSWDYRGFTDCSASCATGKQTAIVKCLNRRQGGEVDDSLCDVSSKPPEMIRICNPQPCPPRWEVSEWTSCSSSCGVGIQTRSVFCMKLLSVDLRDVLTVSEDQCRDFKPAVLQPCNQLDCPSAWDTGPWQQNPATVGVRSGMAGRRKRKGLRSQCKYDEEVAYSDGAGESMSGSRRATTAGEQPVGELLSLMRDLIDGQKRREEDFMAELRELRAALPVPHPTQLPSSQPPRERSPSPVPQFLGAAPSPTDPGSPSPRLGLPTPSGTRPVLRPRVLDAEDVPSFHLESDIASRPEWRVYSDPKIPQYQDGEDIENYLLRFERIAKTWRWPENEWACRLVPLLTGKALDAYTSMDEERAHCYEDLKEALLMKFDVSPETYRQQFRSTAVPFGENPTETYHRLKGLYRRWVRPEDHTKEEIGETIVLEQLLRVLPMDVRTWVKEHEPVDGLSASRLALQYVNARKGAPQHRQGGSTYRQPTPPNQPRPARREFQEQPGTSAPNQRGPGKELVCFYCQQSGHKASVCPLRKAKITGACYPARSETGVASNPEGAVQHCKTVMINGQTVTALLDTGSFTSLVRRKLVPLGSLDYTKTLDVQCVHGDAHPYPTIDVTVNIDGQCNVLFCVK